MEITRYGTELEFIGRIANDGSKIEPSKVPTDTGADLEVEYTLRRLSITHMTWIASNGMSTYIVKLKNPPRA